MTLTHLVEVRILGGQQCGLDSNASLVTLVELSHGASAGYTRDYGIVSEPGSISGGSTSAIMLISPEKKRIK